MRVLLGIIDILLAAILIFVIEYPVIKAKKEVEGKILYVRDISALPLFVAQEEGYFDSLRVKVDMVEAGINGDEVDKVKNGTAQAAFGTDMAMFVYKGAIKPDAFKIIYVTEASIDNPQTKLITLRTTRYRDLKSLEGKRVGYYSRTKDNRWIKYIVKNAGGDPEKVKTLPQSQAEVLSGLFEKNVDYLIARTPEAQILAASRKLKVVEDGLLENYVSAPFIMSVGYTSVANMQFYPEPTKRIVKAIRKAIDFIRNNPDEALKIANKYFEIDSTMAKVQVKPEDVKMTLPEFRKSFELDPSEIQKATDKMLDAEILLKEADFSGDLMKQQEVK